MQFEHELIDRRLNWLLASETILFAAYGLALDKAALISHSFLKAVAFVGLLISAAVFVGVVASLLAKFFIWRDFTKLHGNESEQFWVRTRTTVMGFVPDLTLPIVFAIAWVRLW